MFIVRYMMNNAALTGVPIMVLAEIAAAPVFAAACVWLFSRDGVLSPVGKKVLAGSALFYLLFIAVYYDLEVNLILSGLSTLGQELANGLTPGYLGMAAKGVLLVLAVGTRAKGNHLLIVVLAGVMVSSLFQAGVSFTKLIADPTDQLAAITYWLMGSLTGAKWSDMAFALPPIAIGLAALFALRWRINVLTMGDDEASTMGVNARRVRLIVILAATLVTASSVAISGMIGWVGLVIPHFSRMVIGCDYRKLLPASMLMGASFLLIVDDVARLVASSEIPIGILTAFVGAPFFLYLITRRKQGL